MDFGRLDSVGSGLLCDDLLRDLLPPEPGGVSQDPPAPIAPQQQLFNPLLGSSSAAPGALNLPQNQPAQPACEANPALGLRVLLVDDDCVVLRVLEQMLRMCQYNVTSCTSGTSAVAILRSQPDGFDLVLCDVMMPDMDGFKLLEIVGLEMDLPVIMISGNGDTETVMRGVTHGAVDYLIKPVRIEELRNMWQHVVRRRLEGEPFGMDSSDDDDAMGIEDELPLEQQGLGPDPLSLPMDMSGISLLHPDMHAPDFPDFSHPEAMMPPSVTTPAAQHAHPEAMMPAPAAAAQHAQHAQHGVMLYPPGQLHPPHMPQHAVPQHAVPQHAVSLPQVQPPVPPPPASSHLQQYQQLQQQHQLQRQQLLQQQAQRQAQVQQPLRQPLHHNHHHQQQQELDEEGLPIAPPPPPPHSTSFKPKAKSSGSKSSKPNSHKKRKDVGSEASEEGSSSKKPRVIWSVEMHQQFVNAVNQLGVDKAVPRKILDLMDIGGLTRENVASHLQKYRLYLKKVDANPNEQFHH